MKLYHFTDPLRLQSIKKHGIVKGDVPITMMGDIMLLGLPLTPPRLIKGGLWAVLNPL